MSVRMLTATPFFLVSLVFFFVDLSAIESNDRDPWEPLYQYRWFRYAAGALCMALGVLCLVMPDSGA